MDALQTTVADWLQIIRGEYSEIPGLQLTRKQVQRLWGLDPLTCDALLETLVDVRFLRRTENGSYARAELGSNPRQDCGLEESHAAQDGGFDSSSLCERR
jgi:hypothetical protein